MALKVRTANGKTFHRCGMKFTGDPIIVSNKKLRQPYGSPEPSKTNPTTVEEVLRAERMLVCGPVDDVDPGSGQSDAPPSGGDSQDTPPTGGDGGKAPEKKPDKKPEKEPDKKPAVDSKAKGKGN